MRHAKWVMYFQNFTFSLRHQSRSFNRVVDDLSRCMLLLTTVSTKVIGFNTFNELYAINHSFGKNLWEVTNGIWTNFILINGYFFHGLQFCIPDCSLRQQIISEVHGRDHFGRYKTLNSISSNYNWSKLTSDVAHYVKRCFVCYQFKGVFTNVVGLYTQLHVLEAFWLNVSMNFVLGLSRIQQTMDSILAVVSKFSKMTHFVVCKKTIDVTQIAHLYFKEIIHLYGVPQSITSDHDAKFINYFWKSL